MKCYSDDKKEVNKKYTDAFLNVLSLKVYAPEYDVKSNDLELIKRRKILYQMFPLMLEQERLYV